MQLHLVAIGETDVALLRQLADGIAAALGVAVITAPEAAPLSAAAYSAQRDQYSSARLIREAHKHRPATGAHVLAVTEADLYAPGLNFVFGQADPAGRAAIISLARLRQEFWGRPPDAGLLLARAVKEAVHEVGHILGVGHCADRSCVMYFSNELADTDRKSSRFCARCARVRSPFRT